MRIGHVRHFLLERVIYSYKTTAFGCVIAGVAAMGDYLQTTGDYSAHGKIVSALSTIAAAVGYILAKEQNKDPR